MLGWAALGSVYNIMRSPMLRIKTGESVFNEYVQPVMTYGNETQAFNTTTFEALAAAQRKIERLMFGITLRYKESNPWIRQQTGVKDIIDTIDGVATSLVSEATGGL